jgi:hypothetical protein
VSPTGAIIEIVILNPGSGYEPSTTQVEIVSSLNPLLPYPIGAGFMATVLTSDAIVETLGIITPGTGYTDGSYSNVPLTGGTGSGATADITVVGGEVTFILSGSFGSGYTNGDILSVSNANLGGTIATFGILTSGSSYTDGVYLNVPLIGGTGTGAIADIIVTAGIISTVTIVNGGTGYLTTDILSALAADIGGTGAGFSVAIATLRGSGFSVPLLMSTGAITGVVVDNTGEGYAVISPYLVISNPGSGALTAVTLGTGLSATSIASIAVIQPGTNYVLPISGTVFNPATAPLPNPPASPAVVTINIANNTFGTNPNEYWNVWAGAATNKPIQLQLNAVLSYFTNLGYTIQIISNPATGSTISWSIGW